MPDQLTNLIACLKVALHLTIQSDSEIPKNLNVSIKVGIVASPTPTVGISDDSIKVILQEFLLNRFRALFKPLADNHPAVPPPTTTIF